MRSVISSYVVMVLSLAACSPDGTGGAGPDSSDAGGEVDGAGVGDTLGADVEVTPGDGSEVAEPLGDADFDDIPDGADNCVGIYNPNQNDADLDGIGDLCDPVNDDTDGDHIPDTHDPFPNDGAKPGVVQAHTVYAHTSNELYYLGVKQLDIFKIGNFDFPADADSKLMTDIAIDRYGVLWGISYDDVFVINPDTVEVWRIAALPQSFNGLTLIPRNVLGTATDVLVGISNEGGWWRLDLVRVGSLTTIQVTLLGNYGSSWVSSGDAFSIDGIGTFASVNKGGNDQLVNVDPQTGLVTRVVAPLGTYGQVWGLAGWSDRAYGFDAGGDILILELTTGQIINKKSTGKAWWGAGVKTVLDRD